METIAVSGGAGFIGSHLCERLLKQGSKVICIDNYITGRKENVQHLQQDSNFSLVEQDITKPVQLEGEVHRIYNLASPPSPVDFARIPIEILLTNSLGTRNVLELAAEKGARILHASSSEVYGQPLQHPQKEGYWGNVNPIGERSCYDEGKRFSEALIMAYKRKKNIDAGIARIFNTYGPRMRKNDGRVVPAFITSALANEPITVFGKGKQTRSFCFVTDLVDGLEKLMESSYSLPVNLGNPNEITVLQLAKKVKALTKSKSEIVFEEIPADDPRRRKPDISLAKKELKWKPAVSLEEGLKKTIEWFRRN